MSIITEFNSFLESNSYSEFDDLVRDSFDELADEWKSTIIKISEECFSIQIKFPGDWNNFSKLISTANNIILRLNKIQNEIKCDFSIRDNNLYITLFKEIKSKNNEISVQLVKMIGRSFDVRIENLFAFHEFCGVIIYFDINTNSNNINSFCDEIEKQFPNIFNPNSRSNISKSDSDISLYVTWTSDFKVNLKDR